MRIAVGDVGFDELVKILREVWRVPMQAARDGNTVDAQIEQAQFADAALRYQASLNFLDGRVRSLMTAITGQSS